MSQRSWFCCSYFVKISQWTECNSGEFRDNEQTLGWMPQPHGDLEQYNHFPNLLYHCPKPSQGLLLPVGFIVRVKHMGVNWNNACKIHSKNESLLSLLLTYNNCCLIYKKSRSFEKLFQLSFRISITVGGNW